MADRAKERFDVVYLGFLLGHGGDALQMLALATGVQERGARVKVIVPATEHSISFEERCAGLGIPCERTDMISADMDGSRATLRALLRLLRSFEAPVVHFHTGNSCLPRRAMLALEALRYQPAFATLQSPYETIAPGSSRARFWAWTARRRFEAVVSPSGHGTAFQTRCGIPPRVATTLRNSIDVDTMAGGDDRGPRERLGVGPDAPVVLFSSRLERQKRPLDAVHAFAAVASEFPTAVLAFIGSGDQEDAVSAEAARLGLSDRVRLMGYQTNIPDWLATATVWILPTERENFSVAVLEALAAGCAVLSTSCPGNDEVLIDGHNALIFGVGDVEGAAAGLRKLLANEAIRVELARQARQSAQQYTVDRMVEQYCALYSRLPNAPECLRV